MSGDKSVFDVEGFTQVAEIAVDVRVTSSPPPPKDLNAKSLQWHVNPDKNPDGTPIPNWADLGGVDYQYTVQNAPTTADTFVGFYWASGPDEADILESSLDSPAFRFDILKGTPPLSEPYKTQVTAEELGLPPPGATNIVAILDPLNQLGGANGDQVLSLDASPSAILGPVTVDGKTYKTLTPVWADGQPKIQFNFTPAGGDLTLNQAAAIIGVDHFNWIQTFHEPGNVQILEPDLTAIPDPTKGPPTGVFYAIDPRSGDVVPTKPYDTAPGAPPPLAYLKKVDTAYDVVVDTATPTNGRLAYFERWDGPVLGDVTYSMLPQYWADQYLFYLNEVTVTTDGVTSSTYQVDKSSNPDGTPGPGGTLDSMTLNGIPYNAKATTDPRRNDSFVFQFQDLPKTEDWFLSDSINHPIGRAQDNFFTSFHTALVGVVFDVDGNPIPVPLAGPDLSYTWKSNAVMIGEKDINGGVHRLAIAQTYPGPGFDQLVRDAGFDPTVASGGVFDVNPVVNTAPQVNHIGEQEGTVGQVLSLQVTATDLDGDTLAYTLDPGAPVGASINPSTGVFTFTPTAPGTFAITVRATDNGSPPLSDTQTFQITVSGNPPPSPEPPPSGSPPPSTEAPPNGTPAPTQPIPFLQAVITLYIDGIEKIWFGDPPWVEASIQANLPYAIFFGIDLGQLFVLAGEIAGYNAMNDAIALIGSMAGEGPPPGSLIL